MGFSKLVATVYPAVGFAGLLLLGSLVYGMIKGSKGPKSLPKPLPKPDFAFETAEDNLFDGEPCEKEE